MRRRQKDFHHEPWQRIGHGRPQGSAHERQSAAHNEDLRVQQMDRVGQGEGQVFRCLSQNFFGQRVALIQRGGQVAGLASG